jgi:hypothetical protein
MNLDTLKRLASRLRSGEWEMEIAPEGRLLLRKYGGRLDYQDQKDLADVRTFLPALIARLEAGEALIAAELKCKGIEWASPDEYAKCLEDYEQAYKAWHSLRSQEAPE